MHAASWTCHETAFRKESTVVTIVSTCREANPVMKSGGFFDAHSVLQSEAIRAARPLIQRSAETLPMMPGHGSLGIADYGCSQGKNSILASDYIAAALLNRMPARTINVYRNDLPANDFNRLFLNLASMDRTRSALSTTDHARPQIFDFAVAGSFYQRVLPSHAAHVGFSSSALHWLSRCPDVAIDNHIVPDDAKSPAHQAYANQAKADWEAFLGHRAEELVPGGKLLVTFVGRREGAALSAHGPFRLINHVARRFVDLGCIDRQTYQRFLLPVHLRTLSETIAPLKDRYNALSGQYKIEFAGVRRFVCPFYVRYQETGAIDEYAAAYASFVRALSEPVVLKGLLGNDASAAEQFYDRVRDEIAGDPHTYALTKTQIYVLLTVR
jgi:cyclopropane-fatty-acyl-phospholipid synthase